MFTGLVEELGSINSISKGSASALLKIQANAVLNGSKVGDSIAVNGVCLTVVEIGKNYFTADVMAETMAKSNLADLSIGTKVNLERAAQVGERLGGHIVSGHIDGTGTITNITKQDIALLFTIRPEQHLLRYIIHKGSLAVDGISLTVAEVTETDFTLSLIPHTVANTTLGFKKTGQTVNIEVDMIGKYVEKLLNMEPKEHNKPDKLSMSFLVENGFI